MGGAKAQPEGCHPGYGAWAPYPGSQKAFQFVTAGYAPRRIPGATVTGAPASYDASLSGIAKATSGLWLSGHAPHIFRQSALLWQNAWKNPV